MTITKTELERLLDRCEKELESSMLPVSVFNNDAVFAAEMEQIFGRCWIFVGHETEIPNRGDYVLRRIGLDPVIVVRDESGDINVLSNYCRHRGTELCQVDQGNASHFRCPYHGWIYKNNGDWQSAPNVKQAYRELDPQQWGMFKAPHVGVHQGMIFANVSADAPPLLEYLGPSAWFLDTLFGLHPDGMRVMGPPDRWRVQTDWKSGAENFGGDNYHVQTAHVSLDDIGLLQRSREMANYVRQYEAGDGHIFTGHNFKGWFGPEWDLWGYPPELAEQFDLGDFDEAQKQLLDDAPPVTGTIFPNLTYLRFPGSPDPGVQPFATYTSMRQWQPVAPGVMELWSWQFGWNAASNEYNDACYAAGQNAFSSSGVFEQDDTVVWEGLPHAARSVFPGKNDMVLNYQLGHKGMSDNFPEETYLGPGVKRSTGIGEQNQRSFYLRWLKELRNAT
jgi:N,N-dimethyl phenylurea N-demethylase alpha subunit